MNHAVEHFLHVLQEQDAAGYAYPPADAAALAAFEAAHGITLPPALRELYQVMNGQESEVLNAVPYRLLPLAEIPQVQARLLAHIEQAFGADWAAFRLPDFEDGAAVREVLFDAARLPVFQNTNNDFYCLDFTPAPGGVHGQIVAVMGEPTPDDMAPLLLMFDTFEECLEDIAVDMSDDTPLDIESFLAQTGEDLDAFGDLLGIAQQDFGAYDAAVEAHIVHTLGETDGVLRHMAEDDDLKRIHIHHLAANETRPFQVLITSGLGDPAQAGQEEAVARTELVLLLPPQWNIQADDPAAAWPLQWLQIIAQMPVPPSFAPGRGRIIALDRDRKETLPGTPFGGFFLYPPLVSLPQDFLHLTLPDGGEVTFLALLPLYPAEIALLEEENGLARLFAAFSQHQVTECVDVTRPDCAS